MAKDPAVLFYTQDFLVGSSMLSPLQKGHYITILCHQQQSSNGSLRQEDIRRLMGKDFEKQWPVIQSKFETDINGFFNQRMRTEIEKRKAYSESRRKNKLKDKTNTSSSHDSTYDHHMEIRNKKEEIKKGGMGENNGVVVYDAEKAILDNQIEFQRICLTTNKSPNDAKEELRDYHLYLTEKEQYPKGRKAVFAGFEKWLRNGKHFLYKNRPAEESEDKRKAHEQREREAFEKISKK